MAQTLVDLLSHRSFDSKSKITVFEKTQEDLKNAKTQAFQEGYDQGVLDTKLSLDQQIATVVSDLPLKIENFFKNHQTEKKDILEISLEVALSVFNKFLPTLSSQEHTQEIENFIKTALEKLPQETTVVAKCHPEVASRLKEKSLSQTLKLQEDDSLEPLDTIITWENGTIEKRAKNFLKNLQNLIETIDFSELSRHNSNDKEE